MVQIMSMPSHYSSEPFRGFEIFDKESETMPETDDLTGNGQVLTKPGRIPYACKCHIQHGYYSRIFIPIHFSYRRAYLTKPSTNKLELTYNNIPDMIKS